jgi:hypothetical protein
MRTLYMLRNTFFAVLTVLAAAASSQAAIMLQASDPTPLAQGGLVSYTIRAMGTNGEMINTFTNPVITPVAGDKGVHNVAQAFTMAGTPTRAEHAPGLWNAEWAPYDTHFLFGATDSLSLGPNYEETNDGSTTGMLGLASTPAVPRSGFGNYNSQATSSKAITTAANNVPFMQVIMEANDAAMLSLRVVGDGGGSIGDFTGANAFMIGGGAGDPAPMIADINLGDTANAIIRHTFANTGGPITSWTIAPLTGSPAFPATISQTGMFEWHTGGSARSATGVPYSWTITATGPGGADPAVLSLELVIPEPATMSLIGLAMVGLVGFARRRS